MLIPRLAKLHQNAVGFLGVEKAHPHVLGPRAGCVGEQTVALCLQAIHFQFDVCYGKDYCMVEDVDSRFENVKFSVCIWFLYDFRFTLCTVNCNSGSCIFFEWCCNYSFGLFRELFGYDGIRAFSCFWNLDSKFSQFIRQIDCQQKCFHFRANSNRRFIASAIVRAFGFLRVIQ